MTSTVLITTAINPPEGMPFLKMTNVAARIVTAKAAVFVWAAQGIRRIVMADATGSMLLNAEEMSMLKQMSVDVEQIHYMQNSELVRQRGKGFGEGELLSFALKNSQFLRSETHFFKCTGKLFCRNLPEIRGMIEHNRVNHIFWKMLNFESHRTFTDTRIFYSTRDFVAEFLIPAYLKADDHDTCVEEHCHAVLQTQLKSAQTLRPLLSGFSGTSAEQTMDQSLGVLDTHFPCWVAAGA
jgi:hypothetical protein